jgi:ribose transport system substrate-binding protein
MLRCMEGSASTMEREEGFLEEMKTFPGIEIASSNQYGGATTESAYQASENLLAPFTNADGVLTLNGIFCPNESTTFGMLRALQDGGHAGKVFYVGFDSSDKLIQALAQGEIHGLVIQDPFQMGYLGVKSVMQFLHGQEVVKKVDTGSVVATRENMDNPDVARLLKPDLKQWLNE